MALLEDLNPVYGACPNPVVNFNFFSKVPFFHLPGSSALKKTLIPAGIVHVLFHYANGMRSAHSEGSAFFGFFV